MQYRITLEANVPKRQEFSGTTLVLLDTGAAADIDMSVEISGYPVEELRGVKRGLKMQTPGFTGCKFTSSVACTIEVIVSAANISVNYQEGATVNANILGVVPVSNEYGSPGNPINAVGITYADAPAVTLQDNIAVAVTDAGAALVAANANRRGLRFTNIGTDPVTIGFTGITWAKRCIVLNNGDTWIEDRAANLAWAADCDTGTTASVTVQEVIA